MANVEVDRKNGVALLRSAGDCHGNMADPENDISVRILDVERQLKRKMKMLQKQAGFNELFDDPSRLEAEQLESTLRRKIADIDSIAADFNDSIHALRQIADRNQSQLLSQLMKEIALLEDVDERVETLLRIADFLEVVQSCADDPKTALEYLNSIEQMCAELDQWSGGNLLIVKSIAQCVLNKRYTLEAEHRKTLMKLRDSNKELDPFCGDGSESPERAGESFLAKLRDILRKPLQPTERLSSCDFGGPGDVSPCEVSFWLRPLVLEALETSNQAIAVQLYMSYYKQTFSSLSLRGSAIVLCNSMYFAHQILLHTMLRPSRISLSAAITLRRFSEQAFMERIRGVRFDSTSQLVDELAFAEYPQHLRKRCLDLREILPRNVYEKVLVLLSDHFVKSLVYVLISTEDIETDQADRWARLLSNIVDQMKEIVEDVELPALHRAAELKNILTYGLKDFAARWKSPESELRRNFQANEVRHLIRAIFQNSEMKSSVLAQIH